jgi:hypothetical protein
MTISFHIQQLYIGWLKNIEHCKNKKSISFILKMAFSFKKGLLKIAQIVLEYCLVQHKGMQVINSECQKRPRKNIERDCYPT